MNNLNKKEFRDAIKLPYDWEITDTPIICACGDEFSVHHAMVCQRGGFIIQCIKELRDLETEMLRMVCNAVEVEPVLQKVTGETINHGANSRLLGETEICICRCSGVLPLDTPMQTLIEI